MVNHPNRNKRTRAERRKSVRRSTDPICQFFVASMKLAESIKEEIKIDPELMACTSFEELHEHCDANMLGDLPSCLNTDKEFRLMNAAIGIVDQWLSTKDASMEVLS